MMLRWRWLTEPRRDRGFTLIEIMVVVIILGILAALVTPKFFGQVDKAKIKATYSQIQSLCTAVDLYRLDMGEFPASLEALVSGSGEDWGGPYMKKIPLDAWGEAYSYSVGADDYTISSNGGGKTPLTSDD